MDVTRDKQSNLDVLQEERINDHRNVDGDGFMDRIHEVHFVERNTREGYMFSGQRSTTLQATTRSDYL